jgi:hypothetical protein
MKSHFTRSASLAVGVAILSGCWYHRLEAPSPVAKATEYEGAVAWSFFWGALQKDPLPDNCNGQALAEVKETSNLGFTLLAAITLGLVAPERVEWKCAKAMPGPGSVPGSEQNDRD